MRQLFSVIHAEGGALLEAWRESLRSLASRKMRTFLTMLGMIFGVGAVIAMLAIGEGARQEALGRISRLGPENIIVSALEASEIPAEDLELKSMGLHIRDAQALKGLLPDYRIEAMLKVDSRLRLDRSLVKVEALGVGPGYLELFPRLPLSGRWIMPSDEHRSQRVCVLSAEAANMLAPGQNLIGRLVKLQDGWYSVIGILGKANSSSGFGGDQLESGDTRARVYIPFETMRARLVPDRRDGRLDELILRAPNTDAVLEGLERVKAVIQRRHHGARDVRITVPFELIRQEQETQRMFNLVMGTIASISLLVGGIGIMNIMLSSVLERTREIGIRRAVGAMSAEVLLQFVLEAILIAVGGGLLGVLLGLALSFAVSSFAGWSTAVRPIFVLLAFGVSVLTGLLFGIWPARRAAALDPIVALRHE